MSFLKRKLDELSQPQNEKNWMSCLHVLDESSKMFWMSCQLDELSCFRLKISKACLYRYIEVYMVVVSGWSPYQSYIRMKCRPKRLVRKLYIL